MPLNRHALRVIRERSGLSLSALAVLADVSQPHLSNIERGRRQASPALINRLAAALKVPVVALLVDDGPAGGGDAVAEPRTRPPVPRGEPAPPGNGRVGVTLAGLTGLGRLRGAAAPRW